MLEATLRSLGLDTGRVGTPQWDPLSDVIMPGARVVLKPKFVPSKNFHQVMRRELLSCSSTHGSVRPIIDYALCAAGPRAQSAWSMRSSSAGTSPRCCAT